VEEDDREELVEVIRSALRRPQAGAANNYPDDVDARAILSAIADAGYEIVQAEIVKPCPHCHEECPVLVALPGSAFRVGCLSCGTDGPAIPRLPGREVAIRAWNDWVSGTAIRLGKAPSSLAE
jgi:hypothetical protein